jgi:recombination protein RecA
MSKMEDKFGETFKDVIIKTSDSVGVIPTGSFSLDVSIGIGGIPLSKATTIWGAESAGKTTLALTICANCVKKFNRKALYIDVEQQMDFERIVELVGMDLIESGMVVVAKPKTAENAFEIAEEAIHSNEFGLVVFDSVAALSPQTMQDRDFEDTEFAPTSKLINRFMLRNGYNIRVNKIAILFINQVRDNIGAFRKSYTMPGGHALRHFCSVIVFLSKKTDIIQDKEAIGQTVQFVLKKNKVGVPLRSFIFPLLFSIGVDYYRDLVQFCEAVGVLDRAGPYYKFEGETLDQGLVKTMQYLKDHSETLDRIIDRVYNTTVIKTLDEGEELEETNEDN